MFILFTLELQGRYAKRRRAMRRYYGRQENTTIEHGNTPEWDATSEQAATNSRPGNGCHLPMGGSPFMKNYDNRPFPTIASDSDYD